MPTRTAATHPWRVAVAVVVLVGLATGCSDSGAGEPAPGGTDPGAEGDQTGAGGTDPPDGTHPGNDHPHGTHGDAGAAQRAAVLFEGTTEDFYVVPDDLRDGAPGDLIRYQPMGSTGPTRTWRVMYHSNDASGADRAVTGVVTVPTAPAPEGGWPVVSYGHGTAGMAPRCAPSRRPEPAPTWGIDGIGAATDYLGLGPEGEINPYLSRISEGNSMIDIVATAAQLPGVEASGHWVAVGHSQGGHAALAAHELAAQRAPGLQLAATAALAPATDTDVSYGVDDDLMAVLTMMQLQGGATEHDGIDPADYLTDAALRGSEVFGTGCVEAIIDALSGVVARGPFAVDPWSAEPAASMLGSNRVGTRAVEGVPLLLASGTADLTVVPDRVKTLFARMCGLGQATRLVEVPGADHGSVIPAVFDELAVFLSDALRGSAGTVDGCAPG